MGVNTLPWYYTAELQGPSALVELSGEEWHHCLHVMRMATGDALFLFNGQGLGYEGIIRKSSKAKGTIHINIAFAPTKNQERTETAIEKIVELGVDAITFLDCKNGERSRLRMDRIKKITISAAKQSRKLVLPVFHDFISPVDLVRQWQIHLSQPKIICCHPDQDALPLDHTYQGEENVVVMIGPEGGFDQHEIQQLKALAVPMTALGPYRLRVETAIIAVVANLHLLHGMKTPL
jgi:16S rRNA (uracil1498-N3)-methyltransferase